MEQLKLPYFKIESFGAVDGPGVRLVIFSQGCLYRCLYCHNPESWELNKSGINTITVDEIIEKYQRNISFYKKGGITISGGDPLIHLKFIKELAKKCHDLNISLALDTSGVNFTDSTKEKYLEICQYNPLWIVDVKHINPKKHKLLTGIEEQREINLIKFLDENNQSFWLRQVLIPSYTDDPEDLFNLGKFIFSLRNLKRFEILPYHNMAVDKYKQMGIQYKLSDVKVPTENDIANAMKSIKKAKPNN